MKRLQIIVVLAALLLASTALAQDSSEKKGLFKSYSDWMHGELEKIAAMDLYGVTSQLPKGYASFKWDWGMINAKNRYNNKRKLGPVMQPIEFTNGDKKLISIDMGLDGYGGGHTFQFSYGIIDALDWYIEVPFFYMNVAFNPDTAVIDDDGNRIDPGLAAMLGVKDPKNYNACEFMNSTLPKLGRPAPMARYKGEWLLGDINTGFSWNVYRNKYFSVALTPRVFLPTGHIPSPNSNLLYGTGPELENGIGGWAVGFTQGYDLRVLNLPKYYTSVVLSTEFTASYAFEQEREYPTNFVPPDPMAVNLDPAAFPDLSNLEGTFKYTPGFSVDWTAQLNVQLAVFGLGAGYGVSHSQEPELMGDPAFISMAKGLELLGQQTIEAIQLAASISLLPLYVPAEVAFKWNKVIDGYNAIVFDDYYTLMVKVYIPIMRW